MPSVIPNLDGFTSIVVWSMGHVWITGLIHIAQQLLPGAKGWKVLVRKPHVKLGKERALGPQSAPQDSLLTLRQGLLKLH